MIERVRQKLWLFRRSWARYGLLGLPARALRKVWRKLARNRHLVFTREAGSPPSPSPSGLTMERFETEAVVPATLWKQLADQEGPGCREMMRREFQRGGILWLGLMGGEVAAYQWSLRGKQFKRWYVELSPQDVVLFATVTFPRWRGKGIAPAMMSRIVIGECGGGGSGYIDCKVWNVPASKSFVKAGFRRLEMPPAKPVGE